LGYLIIDDPDRILPLAESMERYQPERVNPPGTHTAYSNYATALAGLIVSNVSGVSFNDYIQQNIFDPLGMKSSSFIEPLPAALAEHMALSYNADAGKFVEKPYEIIANFGPAGAEAATATDMLRFAQALLNGGELNGHRILQQKTVEEMMSRHFSHDDRLMGMGLGIYETDIEGVRVMGHGGDTQWFHSELGIDQEHGLVFFASFGAPGGSYVRGAVLPTFYKEYFPRVEAPPVPPKDFSERAGKYAGSYGFWRSNFSRIEKVASVVGGVKVVPTEDNTLVITLGGKAKQYVEVGDNLFRELDPGFSLIAGISPRLVAFQQDSSGAVTGFVLDGLPFMSLRKLPFYEGSDFNLSLLGFSVLIFLGVLLRRFFQRTAIKSISSTDRTAISSAVYAAGLNVLVLVAGGIVILITKDTLFTEIPLLLKLWLVLPIIATLAGLYLLYRTWGVWKQGLLAGNWARIRFTVVTACALFM
ncbi:MAG: serine hydrolase domain-containing protein, partial [Lysobacterales bacterium]